MAKYNYDNKRLNVADFQHPADKKAVDAVMAVPGFDKVLEFISKNSLERVYGFINNSSKLKVTPEMSPKIFGMLEEAAEMYGETYIPEIYLERMYINIINLDGFTKPHITLPTAWLEAVNDKMLWAVLSAEIAAIQARHGMLEFVENAVKFTKGFLPLGVDTALEIAINDWKRNRIYTVDRAILLGSEDFGLAAKHIMFGDAPEATIDSLELAKPGNPYYQQATEFLNRSGIAGGIQKLETFQSGSQWMASRYIELYKWYFSGQYHEVLERSVQE